MEALKKCPFCGGTAKFRVSRYGASSSGVQIDFTISCSQCGAASPETDKSLAVTMNESGEIIVRNDGRDIAVYEWNKRAETTSDDPSNDPNTDPTDPSNDPNTDPNNDPSGSNNDPTDPSGNDPSDPASDPNSDPTGDP